MPREGKKPEAGLANLSLNSSRRADPAKEAGSEPRGRPAKDSTDSAKVADAPKPKA